MSQNYALLSAGVVVDLFETDIDISLVFPDAAWVPVSAETQRGWTYNEGVTTAPVVLPPTADELKAYAARRRFAVETGGILYNGASIATDRESQAMINGAFSLAQISPDISVQFKTAAGFVTLNAAAITALALAVAAHVQACFAKEQSVDDQITAGTMKLTSEIDIAFTALG
jgi:hypothetical protein